MPSDEKQPIEENDVPKKNEDPAQDVPLTKEEFAAQMQRLTERARAAGLNPIQTMARTYANLGMAMLNGILASLENADSSKKKKE